MNTDLLHPSDKHSRVQKQRFRMMWLSLFTVDSTEAMQRWFRGGVIAISTLTLCSCRTPVAANKAAPCPPGAASAAHAAVAQVAAVPAPIPTPMPRVQRPPMPAVLLSNWAPPGIARPWPDDEYIHDGGDQQMAARVDEEWRIHGLELEDTVVHFDTLDGCTQVEPSNRVHIYAPRFAAVRKVEGVEASLQQTQVVGFAKPERAVGHDESLLASTAMQPLQPITGIGSKQANLFLRKQQTGGLLARVRPIVDLNSLKAYEEFSIIRSGIFDQAEKARLAERTEAALVWSKDDGLQVAIERQSANALTTDQSAQVTFSVDLPGCPRLQVCKVASTQHALPGEFVDFTIRFDNVGQQTMGNITIVDNLTTRLEYVQDSAQSSVKTEFFTERNEGDSLLLRWEVTEPFKPGEGGLVRFRCKVR